MNREVWEAAAVVSGFTWVGIAIAHIGPGAHHMLVMLFVGLILLLIGFAPGFDRELAAGS